jgi:hypothetical protein
VYRVCGKADLHYTTARGLVLSDTASKAQIWLPARFIVAGFRYTPNSTVSSTMLYLIHNVCYTLLLYYELCVQPAQAFCYGGKAPFVLLALTHNVFCVHDHYKTINGAV